MNNHRSWFRGISLSVCCLAICLGSVAVGGAAVAAPEVFPTRREADKHFEHGVALYQEADYRGALVEFLRAYEMAPNGVVLFNIGETQYQLRDYAAALATFERYLADTPQTDAHRALVDANVKELRTRVGRLTITTFPPGAEVSVDDRVIGKSPFERPVVVAIGRLNVRAYLPGHLPVSRSVDVAAEDNLALTLELVPAPQARADGLNIAPTSDVSKPSAPIDRAAWRKAGWIAAGMLAASSVGVGLWALDESRALRTARSAYPGMQRNVQSLADKTLTLSVIADSLGAAALVVGGITLYASVNTKESAPSTQLTAGLGSLTLRMTF